MILWGSPLPYGGGRNLSLPFKDLRTALAATGLGLASFEATLETPNRRVTYRSLGEFSEWIPQPESFLPIQKLSVSLLFVPGGKE